MSADDQKRCAEFGALIEHSLSTCTSICGGIPLADVLGQVRAVGIESCVVSADLGQSVNGPIVPGYRAWLQRSLDAGFSIAEIRTLIVDNPKRLLAGLT